LRYARARMLERPRWILALLTAMNLLNYLDRLVLSAVLPEVQHELSLSKLVGGTLATVFLIGYFATSPIFGSLADRPPSEAGSPLLSRKALISLGIMVWSAATALTGLARGVWGLVATRAVVGVGEASYATIAPTLIDDLAPPARRSRWLAVFYSAMPIGGALGYAVGSAVGKAHGWRAAFYVAGGPGLLLALLCLLIREPPRRASGDKPEIGKTAGVLARIPLYRKSVLGYCAYTFSLGGFAYWAPTFLKERFLQDLGVQFGAVSVAGGAFGTLIGGRLGDLAARREIASLPTGASPDEVDRAATAGNLRVCTVAALIGVPFTVACFLASTQAGFFACAFLAELVLFTLNAPINAAILRSATPALRASAMALSIFAIHLLGDLWSPPLIGFLADHAGMQTAMMAVPLGFFVAGVVWFRR
jgi:MFS transporter, Spinster family, sphingosine-1-phosphate transporter